MRRTLRIRLSQYLLYSFAGRDALVLFFSRILVFSSPTTMSRRVSLFFSCLSLSLDLTRHVCVGVREIKLMEVYIFFESIRLLTCVVIQKRLFVLMIHFFLPLNYILMCAL